MTNVYSFHLGKYTQFSATLHWKLKIHQKASHKYGVLLDNERGRTEGQLVYPVREVLIKEVAVLVFLGAGVE